MSNWSLSGLLAGLHDDIQKRLEIARTAIGHPGAKGDSSEKIWLELLNNYLPRRYQAANAHVVDSLGNFSDQIDVVIFDRQYSPFIFKFQEELVNPAESVYAAFEAKQSVNASLIAYAKSKVASVRKLHRTSLPIPHAGGEFPPKSLNPICGGLLAFESDWSPPLGDSLLHALGTGDPFERLDMGCIAAHGYFTLRPNDTGHDVRPGGKSVTAFLLQLIADLQFRGTVSMIDVQAYARWLPA